MLPSTGKRCSSGSRRRNPKAKIEVFLRPVCGAGHNPASQEGEETLTTAWEIRSVLHGVFAPVGTAKDRDSYLVAYNALLRKALQRLEIGRGERHGLKVAPAGMRWSWREFGSALDSPLWPVVWSGAMLLVSEEGGRIRKCGGEDCGWVYVDRSRNGLRRWCRMETCGTKAKSRRRRERYLLTSRGLRRSQSAGGSKVARISRSESLQTYRTGPTPAQSVYEAPKYCDVRCSYDSSRIAAKEIGGLVFEGGLGQAATGARYTRLCGGNRRGRKKPNRLN